MSSQTDSINVTADELRQIIERWEQLAAEKADLNEAQKEIMDEAKGRGFDTKVIRKVIALRKKTADERQEEESITEVYLTALGMN